MLDFVCVGGNKCGTTWLYEMLRQHSQLNMSTIKEPHYFSHNYDRGKEWYRKNWYSRDGLRGEFSTSYLYSEVAIKRMARDYPDVRVVIMLRHPFERAISHLRHVMREGAYASYGKALYEHPEVIRNSLYFRHVQHVEAAFGAERVLICYSDAIQDAPAELVRRVFTFLNVDPTFEPEGLRKVIGQGFKPRFQYLEHFRLGVYRLLKRNGLYSLIRFIKSTGVTDAYKQLNSRPGDRTEAEELLYQHCPTFCKDARRLVQLPSVDDTTYAERWILSLSQGPL